MLDEECIKEAEVNIRSYLSDGLLKRENFREEIFTILRKNAEQSLEIAEFLVENNKSDFWTIVISYYAMYYCANAVLYKHGLKVGDKISHKITADALIVYVRRKLKKSLLEDYEDAQRDALAGIKADSLIESFDRERSKRGYVQYALEESALHSKAKTSLARAREFLFEMEKLL